ncbi:hypothetical protein VTJ04DRAFT_4237 [Mycothermus thermophilus]|uniref:uncharacterized protein n=1 Tax=Humicola insolens TaxID=85995 RepID=UPI0037427D03
MANKWSAGLCDCFSAGFGICLLGTCCPCFLINKTRDLLENPTKESGDICGGTCCGFATLNFCGLGCILSWTQRGNIRERHNIDGDGCMDCMVSTCCTCCGLIQQYHEVKERRGADTTRVVNVQPGANPPMTASRGMPPAEKSPAVTTPQPVAAPQGYQQQGYQQQGYQQQQQQQGYYPQQGGYQQQQGYQQGYPLAYQQSYYPQHQ